MIPVTSVRMRWLIAVLVIAAIGVGSFVAWAFGPVDSHSQEAQVFEVPSGWGGGRIASELARAGLVRWAPALTIVASLTRTGDSLQAGTYLLYPSMTPSEIVRILSAGQALSDDIVLTVPEGMNIWKLDSLMLKLGITSLAGEFSGSYHSREGRLFPETYRLPKNATAADVAARMEEEFTSRAAGYTPEQIIIASILEREAKTPEDMALVAGIIQKRRARGMALQIDATVAYGWCARTAGYSRACEVTDAPIATEIKRDGPYNTYTRTGLPFGPISSPGLQALNAATHPKDSDYLFYLSTRDGSEIIYSRTLEEHLSNRLKYLGF